MIVRLRQQIKEVKIFALCFLEMSHAASKEISYLGSNQGSTRQI
jgi:hypothetical protein